MVLESSLTFFKSSANQSKENIDFSHVRKSFGASNRIKTSQRSNNSFTSNRTVTNEMFKSEDIKSIANQHVP